ncbi:MAG: cupin domain-containing protein [Acidimicrobiia bacterium]
MTVIRRTSEIAPVTLDRAPVRSRRVISAADGARLGLSVMDIDGVHPWIAVDGTDIVYYVLAGAGWFELDDVRHDVTQGDVLLVPGGTPYRYGGAMSYLNIQSPPMAPAAVRWLDDVGADSAE